MHVHIVEDEPLARRTLVRHVRALEWVATVTESTNGLQAESFIDAQRPDIVMLDISMPGLTGLELCQRLPYAPSIVFTTAYDEHAVAAFELGAIDYLLKPFGRDRVHRALERARRAADSGVAASVRARELVPIRPISRVFVRAGHAIVPIHVDSIERAEGSDDYVTLHVPPREYLVGTRLRDLEGRLPQDSFVRVHRSHIINTKAVERLEIRSDGGGTILMKSGARVPASRSGVARIRKRAL